MLLPDSRQLELVHWLIMVNIGQRLVSDEVFEVAPNQRNPCDPAISVKLLLSCIHRMTNHEPFDARNRDINRGQPCSAEQLTDQITALVRPHPHTQSCAVGHFSTADRGVCLSFSRACVLPFLQLCSGIGWHWNVATEMLCATFDINLTPRQKEQIGKFLCD